MGVSSKFTIRRSYAQATATLPDHYIVKLLNKRAKVQLRVADVPKAIIETKRLQMQIRRIVLNKHYEIPLTVAQIKQNSPTKICNLCNTEKDKSEFGKDKSGIDGYRYCCKACRKLETAKRSELKKIYDKQYYKKNAEWIIKRSAEWAKQNRERVNLATRIRRQKQKEA